MSFLWNGGSTEPSAWIHTEGFGPRRVEGGHFVDNAETLLMTSDLVFYDPVTTGFSRSARPEYDREFLTVLGDFAASTEFIRAYRTKFDSVEQPLFLIGESTGTWRAAGVLDTMAKRGDHVTGAVLVSGTGGMTSVLPYKTFMQALYVNSRVTTAFYFKKLAPELMRDRTATAKAGAEWAFGTYLPALEHIDKLTPPERDKIAQSLARFTGVSPTLIDRQTLVMTNLTYRTTLLGGDKAGSLAMLDMRKFGGMAPLDAHLIGGYFREELGYRTDLTYQPIENGYMPQPGPDRRVNSTLWVWNQTPTAQAEWPERQRSGSGPPPGLPWVETAMRTDKDLRVMITLGMYDSVNGCEGTARLTSSMEPDVAKRFVNVCYESGHLIYEDPQARPKLLADVARFIRDALKK